jgi:hypothetical protein
MIKVAFVDYIGQIAQWASPGDDLQWPDRTMEGDYYVVHLPAETDMIDFSEIHVWHYSTNTWIARPRKPNSYYYWNGVQWQLDDARLHSNIREARNSKLYACDWTQLPDAPVSQELKAEWTSYRQALRDIPDNLEGITDIEQIQWPTPPA